MKKARDMKKPTRRKFHEKMVLACSMMHVKNSIFPPFSRARRNSGLENAEGLADLSDSLFEVVTSPSGLLCVVGNLLPVR